MCAGARGFNFHYCQVRYMNRKVSINACKSLEHTSGHTRWELFFLSHSINEKLKKRMDHEFFMYERLTATCLILGHNVLPLPLLVSVL